MEPLKCVGNSSPGSISHLLQVQQSVTSRGSRGRSCECVSGEQQQEDWEANGKRKIPFSAVCPMQRSRWVGCSVPDLSRCIWYCFKKAKEKKQNLRKGIPNNRYTHLLRTNLGSLYYKIAASSTLVISLYFLFLSSSHLPKSALPDCFTDELKATEIQSLIRIFLNC